MFGIVIFIVGLFIGAGIVTYSRKPKKTVSVNKDLVLNPNYKFHRINDIKKFHELRFGRTGSTEAGVEECNQIFWEFVRQDVGDDLWMYSIDGEVYAWKFLIINSNNVVVHNLAEAGFSESEATKLYALYNAQ